MYLPNVSGKHFHTKSEDVAQNWTLRHYIVRYLYINYASDANVRLFTL